MKVPKKILTDFLIAFALISMGYAFGKHSVNPVFCHPARPLETGSFVTVYTMYSTFRCVTCTSMETMTSNLLNSAYSDALSDGRLRWQKVNFQENEALARKFEIAASGVVVARFDRGEVTDFKRLDALWTLMGDGDSFNRHIRDAIDPYLHSPGGVDA